MIVKAYKFKMIPGVVQRVNFSQFFGSVRFIYNWALDLKIKAYKDNKTSLSYVDLAKKVTHLKKEEDYKCEWKGKNLFLIGRFEPSSKLCSVCGYKNDKLKLSDRMWKCPNCNSVLDRDVNAAINIRNMGLEKYKIHPEGTGGEDAETQESLVVKRQCSV